MLMQEYLLTYYTKPVISTIISFQTVICLTPHALENPVEVTQEEYDKPVLMKEEAGVIVIQKKNSWQNYIISEEA